MRPLAFLALPLVIAGLALPARALACGGMVFPNHSERVGGMREQEVMVVFEADRTVLLASAGYKGAPDGAAFVLPVRQSPSEIYEADLTIFAALDDITAPVVDIFVDGSDSDVTLCGAPAGGDKSGGGNFSGPDIMVLDRGSTATYEYSVIGGDSGTALADWLTDAGYTLPDDYAAALDPYVTDGWYFFAAKVKPGLAEGALPPIELHLPPTEPETFEIPFALGAHSLPPGEEVTLTAYFFAPGGIGPADDEAQVIDPNAVEALSETETNFRELHDAASAGGRWVVDASQPDWNAAKIRSAAQTAIDEGRLPAATDTAGVQAFIERVPFNLLHMTRISTTASADELADLRLTRTAGDHVARYYTATYLLNEDSESGGCVVGGRPLPSGALLLPMLLLLRRRRR